MKRTAHLIHELAMLIVICLLQGWRFTGVPMHEYLAVVVGAAVFAHVLMQRQWVSANVRRLRSLGARARFNVALNASLFIAFVAAMVSGPAISKVLIPLDQSAAEFLRWHELHDVASKFVLFLVGLHVALNWDSLWTWRPRMTIAKNGLRHAGVYSVRLLLAALIVAGAVYGVEKALPYQKFVSIYTKDGRIERVPPPHDLVELRKDQRSPSARGLPKFVVALGLVAVVGVTGRKLLRVRR